MNKYFHEITSLSIVLSLFLHNISSKHDRETTASLLRRRWQIVKNFYFHFQFLDTFRYEAKAGLFSNCHVIDVHVFMNRNSAGFKKSTVRGNWVKMTERWVHIQGKWDIVWVRGGFRRIYPSSSYTYIKYELFVLCTWSTFFVHFFAVVLHDYNVKNQKWRKCRMCSVFAFFFFFYCCSFSPWWPLAFLIFSLPQ